MIEIVCFECSVPNIYLVSKQITILTSNAPTPTTPSVPPLSDWTVKGYWDRAYDDDTKLDYQQPIYAQHVAVVSQQTSGLSLAEVQVYGKFNQVKFCRNVVT